MVKQVLVFFLLLLPACVKLTPNIDAGVVISSTENSVYVERQYKYVKAKYIPRCYELCVMNGNNDNCDGKCKKDFAIIKQVMIRAINDNKEADFYEMLDSYYGLNKENNSLRKNK